MKKKETILDRLSRRSNNTDVLKRPLHGSKLDAVVRYLQEEVAPKGEKAIVFSQYGAMLELIDYWLERRLREAAVVAGTDHHHNNSNSSSTSGAGGGLIQTAFRAVMLTGSMTMAQRQAALHAFRSDPHVRVILISLKAGGEGLNLQHSNHVLLVDPWWNPAVEMQAVQRAHRIGQQREVHAVRFVVADSVEERMLELQAKKMLVFEGTVDGRLESLQQLSSEDLQFLFAR